MAEKTCYKCGIAKALSEFCKDRTRSDGLYPECRDCKRSRTRRYYQENKDRIDDKNRFYDRLNPEQLRDRAKRYCDRNRESLNDKAREYRRLNPDKCRSAVKDWVVRNPDKVRADVARRRAAVDQAVPSWSDPELVELIYSECPDGHEVDHILPIRSKYVCGLHCAHNLQYLPVGENRRKSNKVIVDG